MMNIFRALLRLLPFDFRTEHGREMEQVFKAQRDVSRLRGVRGLVQLWIETLVDVITTAPSQHVAMLRQDVGYALHALRRAPGFTAAAVLTLAIGISGSASIFTIINAFLFRPLPVDRPEQLVSIASLDHHIELPHGVSYPDLRDYSQSSPVFSGLLGYQAEGVWIDANGSIDRVVVEAMTENAFGLLGVGTVAGRTFAPGDARSQVIVLAHDYWRTRFNADPGVVGTTVRVNEHPFTVVGVAAESFNGLESLLRVSAFVPLTGIVPLQTDAGKGTWLDERDAHALQVIGRLRPDVSLDQARSALAVQSRALALQYPQTNRDVSLLVVPETYARPVPQNGPMFHVAAVVLALLAALLLIIASANLANMLLARASARGREMALRAALGARQGRIVRQLITEGLVLATLGSAAAIVITVFASAAMERGLTGLTLEAPIRVNFGIDWRVLGLTLTVGALAGVLSSVAPAAFARRADVNRLLKAGGRTIVTTERGRIRRALIVAQVAVSLVLLIVGGLFVKTSAKARTVNLGFRADHVLMARIDLPRGGYTPEKRPAYYRDVRARILALPGVRGAAWISSPPFSVTQDLFKIRPDGLDPEPGKERSSFAVSVGTEYFSTANVPIVSGRAIDDRDDATAPRAIVVNETLARQVWPAGDPVGKFLIVGNDTMPSEVVGVARDGKYIFLWESPRSMLFQSMAQIQPASPTLEVVTSGTPEDYVRSVRTAIQGIDPQVPLFEFSSMASYLEHGSAFVAFNLGAFCSGLFGVLGLVLASLGLYGVVAFDVNQRTHEMGVRMALGARRGEVVRAVVARGAAIATAGLIAGSALAAGVAWPLRNMFLGVSPFDAQTYLMTAAVLMTVCVVASFIPARRAATANPVDTLRAD